jgi:hypothetical protein
VVARVEEADVPSLSTCFESGPYQMSALCRRVRFVNSAHHIIVPHLCHILVYVPLEGIPADLILDLPVHDPRVKETLNKEQTLSQPPQ